MDHLLHHTPKKADPLRGALRGGRTWFSGQTIHKARQFTDVSWVRLLMPALMGVALMLAGQTILIGDGAALFNLAGLIVFIFSLNGIISRAWQDLSRR